MSDEQKECHIELASFADLARMACSYHEHPRRVYSHMLDGVRIASTTLNLANTLAVMYAPMPKDGRYISYSIDAGRESCGVTDAVSNTAARNAPVIRLKSGITHLEVADKHADNIPDVFRPVELADMGSLARLTYDPDFPDEPDLTLYAVPVDGSWVLGYLVLYEMDVSYYGFYHVRCDAEPDKPFLRYRHDSAQEPELTDTIEHGSLYMPIVKIKHPNPIFGFGPKTQQT